MRIVRPVRFISIVVIFFGQLFCQAQANVNNKTSLNKELTIISSICKNSPFDCLANVDDLLNTIPSNSRIYFEVLQYKYEALFNLQHNEALYNETKKWLNNDKLPILFQITNAIYFAKTALDKGEKEASVENYLLAKSLLGQINEQYPSPIRLVQFANLQMMLKEYQQAYDLLLGLSKKYQNSPDSHFMLEMFGNLAHITDKLGRHQEAITYWQQAKKWSEIFGNKQQIAVVLFNMGNSYYWLKQYPQAADYFNKAIEVSLIAGDSTKANQARMGLINTLLNQQQDCQAKQLYQQIDIAYLSKTMLEEFNALKQQLNC